MRLAWRAKSLLDWLALPWLLADRNRLDRIDGWPALIATICQPRGRWKILANQHPAEIGALVELAQTIQPRIIVEIGSARGGTLYLWSRIVGAGGMVISVDSPGAVGSVRPPWRWFYRRLGRGRARISTVDGDSHALPVQDKVDRLLEGRPVDFLFIDGDHSYEGVRADFVHYLSRVRAGGLAALHDIALAPDHPTIAVPRFWEEIKHQYPEHGEWIAEPGKSPGIGWIRK